MEANFGKYTLSQGWGNKMLQRVMESVPFPPSQRDIRKAVLKLRWIGLEVEAEKLEQRLSDATPPETAGSANPKSFK